MIQLELHVLKNHKENENPNQKRKKQWHIHSRVQNKESKQRNKILNDEQERREGNII